MSKPICHAVVGTSAERRVIRLVGRFAQTLRALVEAGPHGVTALEISTWALRLAHYVHVLRREYGLHIETIRESHGDGWHGRYVLLTPARIVEGAIIEGEAA